MLVNGQDFFNGSPKLALQNLPTYSVSKIKIYNREGPASRMMGRDMGDSDHVMDVRLKKEYATGTWPTAKPEEEQNSVTS